RLVDQQIERALREVMVDETIVGELPGEAADLALQRGAGGGTAIARGRGAHIGERTEPGGAQAGLEVFDLSVADRQARYRAVERDVVGEAMLDLGVEAQRAVVDVGLLQRLRELIEAGERGYRLQLRVRVIAEKVGVLLVEQKAVAGLAGAHRGGGDIDRLFLLPPLSLRAIEDEAEVIEAGDRRDVQELIPAVDAAGLEIEQIGAAIELDLPAHRQLAAQRDALQIGEAVQRERGEHGATAGHAVADQRQGRRGDVAKRELARVDRPEQAAARIALAERGAQEILIALPRDRAVQGHVEIEAGDHAGDDRGVLSLVLHLTVGAGRRVLDAGVDERPVDDLGRRFDDGVVAGLAGAPDAGAASLPVEPLLHRQQLDRRDEQRQILGDEMRA